MEWIKMKDATPDFDGQLCLVVSFGEILPAKWVDNSSDFMDVCCHQYTFSNNETYWMPLPQPPKD